jgi:hypothetical protein
MYYIILYIKIRIRRIITSYLRNMVVVELRGGVMNHTTTQVCIPAHTAVGAQGTGHRPVIKGPGVTTPGR